MRYQVRDVELVWVPDAGVIADGNGSAFSILAIGHRFASLDDHLLGIRAKFMHLLPMVNALNNLPAR